MDVVSSYRQIYQENRETYESFLKEREEDIVVHEVLTCYIPKYIDYFETIYIVISRPDKSIISRAEEILLCAKEEFNNSILNIRADYISYIYPMLAGLEGGSCNILDVIGCKNHQSKEAEYDY